jgi:putative tricarboxylic transport membrane protein
MMVEETQMVAVRADSNIKSATDLVTALRKDASSLKIGVAPALGSGTHLSIAKPLKVAGVDIKNLTVAPFKASSETMGALLGGHIDVISATAPVIMPQVAAGKVRVLASASPTRGSGPLAQVPTWREQGIAADFVTYNGLLLPPHMSAAQIAFWEDALRKVSQHPAWLALVEKNGGRPVYRDHAESMKYMVSEQKSINELVQELGLGSK